MENIQTNQQNEYSFEIPEFNLRNHSVLWYLILFALFVSVLIYAIKTKEIILAVLIVLGSITFYELATALPKKIKINFTNLGIYYKDRFYPWGMFKAFTIFGDGESRVVHLEKLAFISGPLVFSIPEKGTYTVNSKQLSSQAMLLAILRYYLPEKLHAKMNLTDWINKVIKV